MESAGKEEKETSNAFSFHHDQFTINWRSSSSASEIEEENSSNGGEVQQPLDSIEEDLFEGSLFSFDVQSRGGEDCVYVAVGKSDSSMDALSWTLKNLINGESTVVYLIHVYPEIHHIPSPLGKLPKNQVNPEQVEIYMAQERDKRSQLLQKFLKVCSASKVKVDTMLVESDMVAKAILDLIPILNIRKLVLGTTKSGLRKIKAKKGSGIAQIVENASEFCEIKIICEGKDVSDQMTAPPSPSPSPSPPNIVNSMQLQNQPNNTFACMCFKSPSVM